MSQEKKFKIISGALAALLIISLVVIYNLYQQDDDAKGYVYNIQDRYLADSILNIDRILTNGYQALASKDEEKVLEYLDRVDSYGGDLSDALRYIPSYQAFQDYHHVIMNIRDFTHNVYSFTDWIKEDGFTKEREELFASILEEYEGLREKLVDVQSAITNEEIDEAEKYLSELEKYTDGDKYQFGYYNDYMKKDLSEQEKQVTNEDALSLEEIKEEKEDVVKEIAKDHLEGYFNLDDLKYHDISSHPSRDDKPQNYEVEFTADKLFQLAINLKDEVIEHRIMEKEESEEGIIDEKRISVEKTNLDWDEAINEAENFLSDNVGISMEDHELETLRESNGKLHLSYHQVIDDILFIPDQVQVSITLDDGTIEHFVRTDFFEDDLDEMVNDLKEKEVLYSKKEAKNQVNPRNVFLSEPTLIYDNSGKLQWRVPVETKGEHLLIYIDAKTGEETSIRKMYDYHLKAMEY
ncbi:PepSY1/2 domain-containing protein [Natranaerobius trueperi]|uniref:Sporulation protein YpeB PepSY1 and PepSY2 domain-containing protein n=1 Tax=Natranaerobius trueperi TaxID=759412 RepID=A0A226C0H7_9FIRM|nr:PepSY1/2 domain-containing protein [Natranaerobius trueperi]OWZ83880.1 hypothetical protein CDO51_06500 [Natranaerobius trueperi]